MIKNLIKESNQKRYKRFFKLTKDAKWIAKLAESGSGDEFESLGLISPDVVDLAIALDKVSSEKSEDFQDILGSAVCAALAKHYRHNLNKGLPVLKNWRLLEPKEAFEDYIYDFDGEGVLEDIRSFSLGRLVDLEGKDLENAKKVLSSKEGLLNLIHYALLLGYNNLYAHFLMKNPLVGLLPQSGVIGSISSLEIPLSSFAAKQKKSDFILRGTVGPRLDDYVVGLRIGLGKTIEALRTQSLSDKKRDAAFKSIVIYSAYIDYAERGLLALKQAMENPKNKSLKYYATGDYLTENPYVANLDGNETAVGVKEFIRGVITDKAKNAVPYINWKGETDYWRGPEPGQKMIYRDYVESVVSNPNFNAKLGMEVALSEAYNAEFKAVDRTEKSEADVGYLLSDMKEGSSLEDARILYAEMQREVALALHSFAKENRNASEFFRAHSQMVTMLKEKLISHASKMLNPMSDQKNAMAVISKMLPSNPGLVDPIARPGNLFVVEDDQVKSKLFPADISYWKKDDLGTKDFPVIMRHTYFAAKYRKNSDDYNRWVEIAENDDFVDKINEDLPLVDDDFLAELGIKSPSGLYDMEFLESVRQMFLTYRTLGELDEKLGDIHHSSLFIQLGKKFLTSFGEDMKFLVGIKYHLDRVQGGETSIGMIYDPRVGQVGPVDITGEEEEQQTANAVKNVNGRINRGGFGNMEKRKESILNPDQNLALVLQAIDTGDTAEYFSKLETEIRPAKRMHKDLGIRTLDTQSAGGIFEKVYLDGSSDVWSHIDKSTEAFYGWLTMRYRMSMGKHVYDRNRTQLTQFVNSGIDSDINSRNDLLEAVGAFADPFKYKNKEDGLKETADHALVRACSKLGMIYDHNLVSTYKKYFDEIKSAYENQNKLIGEIIIPYKKSSSEITMDPFNKHPKVLQIKADIESQLEKSGIELGEKTWIKAMLKEIDADGELEENMEEFQPSFNPEGDSLDRDRFNINNPNDVLQFINHIPGYAANAKDKEKLFLLSYKLPEGAYANTITFTQSLDVAINDIEDELSSPEELRLFLKYIADIVFNDTTHEAAPGGTSKLEQVTDDVRDYLKEVESLVNVNFNVNTMKDVLQGYMERAESLVELGENLIDQGDDIINNNPEGSLDLQELIGNVDSQGGALFKLEEFMQDLGFVLEEVSETENLPLSRVTLTDEKEVQVVEEDEDEITEEVIVVEDDDLEELDSEDLIELDEESEPDTDEQPKSPEPKFLTHVDFGFDPLDVEEDPEPEQELEVPAPIDFGDEPRDHESMIDVVPVSPFKSLTDRLDALYRTDEFKAEVMDQHVFIAIYEFINLAKKIMPTDIEDQTVISMLEGSLGAAINQKDYDGVAKWFSSGVYPALKDSLHKAAPNKIAKSGLDIRKILSVNADPGGIKGTDEDEDFYYF